MGKYQQVESLKNGKIFLLEFYQKKLRFLEHKKSCFIGGPLQVTFKEKNKEKVHRPYIYMVGEAYIEGCTWMGVLPSGTKHPFN